MHPLPAARHLSRALAVPALLAAAALAGAQAPDPPVFAQLSPDPLAANLAVTAEPLPLADLEQAGIVFSGATESEQPAVAQRLQSLVDGFRRQTTGVTDARTLGEQALVFLHANVLTRYAPLAARVDAALATGEYNCVSSAVLYLILARSVGLPVRAARTSDHVLCVVEADGRRVDVETTNRYGFDPGTRKEFTDTFGAVTGFTYVPPTNYRARQDIGEKELLSLILHDRVSLLVDRGQHLAAIGPAMTEWTLAPSELSHGAMVTSISNAASSLAMARRFAEACDLLARSAEAIGAEPALEKRRGEITHNWVVALAESGELDAADALLADPARASFLEDSDRGSLAAWIIELRAEAPARRGDYQAAADLIAAGLARLGANAELLHAFETYSHNVFARAYNARRFAEARAAADAALARYPGSRLLQQDRDLAAKASP